MDDLNLGEDNRVDALGKTENFAPLTSQMEQLTQHPDSFEVESTKKGGKCNLRKSLAWDAAFFTSAGVLDPDELSSMIDGGSSSKRQVLPGIEEDIYRSTDSLSTYGSENLSLESLEIDLFEDIRASIQRSSKASNRAKSNKAASGDAGNEVILSIKEDLASKNDAKSSAGLKKQTSLPTLGKLNMQSSNKPQGTSTRPIVGVQTPSRQKSTKASTRPTPGPSAAVGRSSLRANQVQLENSKGKAVGKVALVPKVPGFNGSNRTVSKPVLPSKSTSSSSSTATKKETSKLSSSSDSSTSNTSASSNRRKIATRCINPIPSNSTLKTPSRVAMKKKEENGLSASLRSSKISSSISPASSISEWSVASSSSTSSVNQSSNSMGTMIGAGSPRESRDNVASLNDVRRSTDRGLGRPENKVSRPNNEKTNAASIHRGAPPRPETAKPSGLRMPSPKIGFFDGVKSAAHAPNGSSQSRSGIPSVSKVGHAVSTSIGVSSKEKSPKLQTTKLVKPIGNIKLDAKKSATPLPSKKISNASTNVHGSPKNIDTPLNSSPITHSETNEEKFSITKEKGVEENCETKGGETENISPVDVGQQINANMLNLKTVTVDGDINDCKGKMTFEKEKDVAELISKKNSIGDLKSNVYLEEQMNDNLMNLNIVPNGDTYEGEQKMAYIEKSKDVKFITEKFSPAHLKNEMNLDKKLSAYSVNVMIDLVDGEIHDFHCGKASKEENSDVTCFTEKISPVDVKNDINLEVKMSAYSANTEIFAVDESISDSVGTMLSEERSNDVKSITEKISLAGLDGIYDWDEENASKEERSDVACFTEKISPVDEMNDMNLEVKMSAKSTDTEIVAVGGSISDSVGTMPSEEMSNEGKISPADEMNDMNLEVKMSAKSADTEIVEVDGSISDSVGTMPSEEMSNDVKSSTEKISLADLESNLNLNVNISAISVNKETVPLNSVYDNIVPMDGDIMENMVYKEKLEDEKLNVENICDGHVICKMNSVDTRSSGLVNVNIDPANGEIYDCEGKMVFEEKNNDVKPVAEKLNPADLKSEKNLDEKLSANSVNLSIDPVGRQICDCEGKPASEEKNNEVTSITEKISPSNMNNNMMFDMKMTAYSEDMEIVPVNGNIDDSRGKTPSKENSNDVKSSTGKNSLAVLKSDMDLEVEMSANSGNMDIVSVDGDIYDCHEKMASEDKSTIAIPINENISLDELESDMNMKVKMSADLVTDKIVPVDGNNGGNVVCKEKAIDLKLNLEKPDHDQVICETILDEKGGANLVNVNFAPMDRNVYESGVVCLAKRDNGKSEIQHLINNWNSFHKSAEKKNQVGGFNVDIGHGCSEHDLQKENAISFISSPKDLGQTDEFLINRTPFTEKTPSYSDERCDPSTELSAVGMEKITPLPFLECPRAEN